MESKSLNQLFKESGTTVPFTEFVRRHNEKKQFSNAAGDTTVPGTAQTVNFMSVFDLSFKDFKDSVTGGGSDNTSMDDGKVLGLNKTILYISLGIVVVSIMVYFYKNRSNKAA